MGKHSKRTFILSLLGRRTVKQWIASVLVPVFLLQPFAPFALIYAPAPAVAAEVTSASNPTPDNPVEVPGKRTAESQHFDNGDGTFTAKIYSSPVHYRENGEWKKINANIKASDTGGFENTAGPFKARFGAHAQTGAISSFEYDGTKVDYIFAEPGASDVAAEVSGQKVTYKNVLPSTDVRQILTGSGVKEDIILNRYTGNNAYTFEVKLAGVEARKESDGGIGFYRKSNGEKAFYIPKPHMVDSNIDPLSGESARSEAVTADIVQQGAKTYVTITADEAWLKNPARVYPVYIDPTTNIYGDDAYVRDLYPNNNYDAVWASTRGGYYQLPVGYYDSANGWNYPYVSMDVSSVKGKLVTGAALKMFCNWSPSSTSTSVSLNRVNGAWSPSTITYNNRPGSTYVTSSSSACPGSQSINWWDSGQWFEFNVTSTVGSWAKDPSVSGWLPNHGFSLHTNPNGQSHYKILNASGNTSGNPTLAVTYSDPPDTPWQTAQVSDGVNSGSGYTNIDWSDVSGATGYIVYIWNGVTYEAFDTGSSVSNWTTNGKGIWPTSTEISAGRHLLHHDQNGVNLSDNPKPVYQNSGGSYGDTDYYYFRVAAKTSYSVSNYSSSPLNVWIPDSTAPPQVASVGIQAFQSSYPDKSNIQATWTGVSDYDTGSNSGTNHYTVLLEKQNANGSYSAVQTVSVTHDATGSPHEKTFYNQPKDNVYRLQVNTYDNNSNFSAARLSSALDTPNVPSVGQISAISGDPVAGTITVTADASDARQISSLNLTAKKYLANGTWDYGTVNAPPSSTTMTGSYSVDTTGLADGEYEFVLTAKDSDNLTTQKAVNLKVDNVGSGMGFGPWSMVENRYGSVNMSNGNYVITQEDIDLSARGLGTKVSRVYNSQVPTRSGLGTGWRLDIPEIAKYSDGSVMITDGDGTELLYTSAGSGTYNGPVGEFATLTSDSNGLFTWKQTDRTKYIFETVAGRLTVEDRNSNTTVYGYNAVNRLTAITDDAGNVSTFTYNGGGRLTQITDHAGRTFDYSYDAANKYLTGVATPITTTIDATWGMTYDASGKLSGLTDPNGDRTTFAYSDALLSSVKDPLGTTSDTYFCDPANGYFTRTDALGKMTESYLDGGGQKIREVDALGHESLYSYDSNRGLTGETLDATGATPHASAWEYDSSGNLKKETDPENHSVQYWYNSENDQTRKVDAMGVTTDFAYDSKGNLLSDGSTTYTYDSQGDQLTSDNPASGTVTYEYDPESGLLVSETDSADATTTYDYDAYGNKTFQSGGGSETTSVFDLAGRLAEETTDGATSVFTYDNSGHRLTDKGPLTATGYTTYDALGRVSATQRSDGTVTSKFYDAGGQLIREIAPDSVETTFGYDPLGREITQDVAGQTSSSTYDALGNLTESTDPLGLTTRYEYDRDNNLAAEINPKGKETTYSYDASHKRTGRAEQLGVDSIETTMKYDGLGNHTQQVNEGATLNYLYLPGTSQLTQIKDPLGRVTGSTYDATGNLILTEKPNGASLSYGYDSLRQLTGVSYDGELTYGMTYDAGKLTEVRRVTGSLLSFSTFDAESRLTERADYSDPARAFALFLGYDDASRLKSSSYAGVTTDYGYDSAGRLNTLARGGSTLDVTYDATGKPALFTRDSGVSTGMTFDAAGKMTGVSHIASGATLDSQTYTYDSAGNITSDVRTFGVSEEASAYQYDDANRLTHWTDETIGKTHHYIYNKRGDLLKVEEKESGGEYETVQEFNVDLASQIESYTDSRGGTPDVRDFDHDAAGNLISDDVATYAWDAADRLTSYVKPGTSVSYEYDENGYRTRKTVNGETTYYHWQGHQMIAETNASGDSVATYAYPPGEYVPIEMTRGGESYQFVKNARGDVTGIINSSGDVVARYSYDPWGSPLSISDGNGADVSGDSGHVANKNPWRYAGYHWDTESGAYYLQARYYRPDSRRFISVDPVQSRNVYSYADSNPVTNIDPNGSWSRTWKCPTANSICSYPWAHAELRWNREVSEDYRSKGHSYYERAKWFKEVNVDGGRRDYKYHYGYTKPVRWGCSMSGHYCKGYPTIRMEDFGNLNFGYSGRALGLFLGAPDDWHPGTLLWGSWAKNGKKLDANEKRDQKFITFGWQLYGELRLGGPSANQNLIRPYFRYL